MQLRIPINPGFTPALSLDIPTAQGLGRLNVQDYRRVSPIVRWAFYAFIFTLPFGIPNRGIPVDIPTLAGCLFLLATLRQSHICFRPPVKAFWCFVVYLYVYIISSAFNSAPYLGTAIELFLKLLQLIFVFWTAYNLMRFEGIARAFVLTLVVACLARAVLQVSGVGTSYYGLGDQAERLSALGQNANNIAKILAVGTLALIGITYGRYSSVIRPRLLVWPLVALLGIVIIQTGSRGALLSLGAGVAAFMLTRGTLLVKVRNVLLVLLAFGFLIWSSFNSESMRLRFGKTIESGSMAQRENIFPALGQMFVEKPLLGWGPISNQYELESRLAEVDRERRDAHNLFLEILTTTGLLGAIPFFTAVWLCVRAAWKSRSGAQGILPFAMTVTVLMSNMSGNGISSKLLWLLLAYDLASASHFGSKKSERVVAPLLGAYPRLSYDRVVRATLPANCRPL